MEAATSPNVQIAVTQAQQLSMQQQQGTSTSATPQNIQIFEDQNNPGKALYILDPSQAGGGQLQVISNADHLAGVQNITRTAGDAQSQQSLVVSFSH